MGDHSAPWMPVAGEIQRVVTDRDCRDMLAVLRRTPVVGLDVETTGLNPRRDRLRTVQLAVDRPDRRVWVIDLATARLSGQAMHDLSAWLGSGRSLLVAHNAAFEWQWVRQHLHADIPRLFCTMVAEYVLNAGRQGETNDRRKSNSLAGVLARRWGVELDKGLQTSFDSDGPLTDDQVRYAATDAAVVLPLYRAQLHDLQRHDLVSVMQLETRVTRVLASMTWRGFPFDAEKRRAALAPQRARLLALDAEIQAALHALWREYRDDTYRDAMERYCALQARIDAGLADGSLTRGSPEVQALRRERGPRPKPLPDDINVNSGAQLRAVLARAGVTLPNLQAETVAAHRDRHPVLGLMAERADVAKDVSTYGDNLIALVDVDGRIHPEFTQVVDTGRTSSHRPNAQNLPPHVRACVVAPAGRTLVVADFNNLELRVLAGLSKDPVMLAAFAAGRDLHCEAAAKVWNLDYDAVRVAAKTPPESRTAAQRELAARRQDAKVVNFGIAFGLTEWGLARNLNRDVAECRDIIEGWKRVFQVAAQWLDERATFAVANGYTSTALGRKRWFPSLPPKPRVGYDREYETALRRIQNEGKNTPIQGTAGDIAKTALTLLHDRLAEAYADAFLVNFVHDEMVVECRAEDAQAVADIVRDSMQEAGRRTFGGAPDIIADASITPHWAK